MQDKPLQPLQLPNCLHPLPPNPSSILSLGPFLDSLRQWKKCKHFLPTTTNHTSAHTELLQQFCTTYPLQTTTRHSHIQEVAEQGNYQQQFQQIQLRLLERKKLRRRPLTQSPQIPLPPPYSQIQLPDLAPISSSDPGARMPAAIRFGWTKATTTPTVPSNSTTL